MPELPEVETVRRGLQHAVGRTLLAVETRREGLRYPFPAGLCRLVGNRLERIDRVAKYLLFRFEGPRDLLVHLGMTGRFGREEEKHSHLLLHFVDGLSLVYTDPRRFGIVDLVEEGIPHPLLDGLAADPLEGGWSVEALHQAIHSRRAPIKQLLMDQRVVAGLGNIYASEVLFRAGVSPRRLGRNVSLRSATRIHAATREVLEAAIAAGGSTLSDGQFRGVEGDLGYFPHEFAVYDREGAPCIEVACGGIVKRVVQGGRSTFFCGRCQR